MRKGVLRNFTKFTGKHLCQSLFFNKVAGQRNRCFPVNFVKFHIWETASIYYLSFISSKKESVVSCQAPSHKYQVLIQSQEKTSFFRLLLLLLFFGGFLCFYYKLSDLLSNIRFVLISEHN